MEPDSSMALPADVLGDRVPMDGGSIQGFMNQVTEHALGFIDFKRQWEDYEESMKLLRETVREHVREAKRKEEESALKQSEEVVKKDELEAREKELSLTINELKKKEEEFQQKQEAEAREIEVKRNALEVKEKIYEELMRELEVRKQEVGAEAKEIEVKRNALELKEKQLEERERVIEQKKRELDEQRSKQAENNKKRDDESENDRDHTGGKNLTSIGEHNHCDKENEADSDCELYGRTSSDQEKGREIYEVECIDDDEDPEPYNCLDADFNNFNNTMSSFSVGQVWALYDPLDHMPRYYALIRRILKHQLRVQVTWLEPKQTEKKPSLLPIACGEFKYGEKNKTSHLMFSHEMHHIRTGTETIIINPRKGETWALFRDWKQQQQKQKRPYSYDFVKIETNMLDSDDGIGVTYLGRVEGFTSVYKHAPQHGCLQMLIPFDEMLRFSHRVPSFELNGDDDREGGVPAGSFELDPAAIPRDYLEAFNVKEE